MPSKLESITTEPKRRGLYIDESRQRIGGEWFIVAGVAVEDSDKFRQLCVSIEKTSRKNTAKWGKANRKPPWWKAGNLSC